MTTKSTCPACLGTFRTNKHGQMMRHGFSAHNVRHGANSGWHTGACPGTGHQPLGTVAGNAFALRMADDQERVADAKASLPAFTTAEALAAQIRNAQESVLGRAKSAWHSKPVITDEQRAAYATPEAFAGTPVRGWFSTDQIEYQRTQMQKRRGEEIASRREHAALLRAAVAQHPVATEVAA